MVSPSPLPPPPCPPPRAAEHPAPPPRHRSGIWAAAGGGGGGATTAPPCPRLPPAPAMAVLRWGTHTHNTPDRHGGSPPPTSPLPPRRGGGVSRHGPGLAAGGRPGVCVCACAGGSGGVRGAGGGRPYLLAALVVGEGGQAGARRHREQHFPEREGPGRAGSRAGPRLTSRPGARRESGLAPAAQARVLTPAAGLRPPPPTATTPWGARGTRTPPHPPHRRGWARCAGGGVGPVLRLAPGTGPQPRRRPGQARPGGGWTPGEPPGPVPAATSGCAPRHTRSRTHGTPGSDGGAQGSPHRGCHCPPGDGLPRRGRSPAGAGGGGCAAAPLSAAPLRPRSPAPPPPLPLGGALAPPRAARTMGAAILEPLVTCFPPSPPPPRRGRHLGTSVPRRVTPAGSAPRLRAGRGPPSWSFTALPFSPPPPRRWGGVKGDRTGEVGQERGTWGGTCVC